MADEPQKSVSIEGELRLSGLSGIKSAARQEQQPTQPPPTQPTEPTEPTSPSFLAGPEPARLYGYIVLHDASGNPSFPAGPDGKIFGYPAGVYIHMVSPTGATQDCGPVGGGGGIAAVTRSADGTGVELQGLTVPNAHDVIALYYEVVLAPDTSMTGLTWSNDPASGVWSTLHYSPNEWRFLEMGPTPVGSAWVIPRGHAPIDVSITRSSTPIAGLPDPPT